jgi:hypothetical protein
LHKRCRRNPFLPFVLGTFRQITTFV